MNIDQIYILHIEPCLNLCMNCCFNIIIFEIFIIHCKINTSNVYKKLVERVD